MPEYLTTIEIKRINHSIETVPAKIITRGGWKSPTLLLIEIDGRWITPFEQARKNIELTLHGSFKILYYLPVKNMFPDDFPLILKPASPPYEGFVYKVPKA